MGDNIVFNLLHAEMIRYLLPDDDSETNKISNLEYLGFLTGYKLIEKATKDQNRFKDELEIMKFLCTDFWSSIFQKPVDNLRTNHQNVYIVQDDKFKFLVSMAHGSKQYIKSAPKYVTFTCGLIRGALMNLGLESVVTSEVETMPVVKFHIEINHS